MFFSMFGVSALWGILLGGLAAWWAYRLAERKGQSAVGWAVGSFLIPPIVFLLYKDIGTSGVDRPEAVESWDHLAARGITPAYAHFHKGTGIALDTANRRIYLASSFDGRAIERDYSFDDVREWNTNVQTGGHAVAFGTQRVNAAIGMGVHNYMTNRKNEAESGLFVTVRDIDHPVWRVAFPPTRDRNMQLSRWMEIMRQTLNETPRP